MLGCDDANTTNLPSSLIARVKLPLASGNTSGVATLTSERWLSTAVWAAGMLTRTPKRAMTAMRASAR